MNTIHNKPLHLVRSYVVKPSREESMINALSLAEEEHTKRVLEERQREEKIEHNRHRAKEIVRQRLDTAKDENTHRKESKLNSLLKTQKSFIKSWDNRIS